VLEDEKFAIEELRRKAQDGRMDLDSACSTPHSQKGLKGLVQSLKGEAEAREIQRVLESTHWDRRRAATELNISYKALCYKIKQYRVSPNGFPLGKEDGA